MDRALTTATPGPQGIFQAVVTPDLFATTQRARLIPSTSSTVSRSQSHTPRASPRPSQPSRSHSQAPSQLADEWYTDNEELISSSASSSSDSDSDSASSSSDDDQQRKGKKRKRKAKANKKNKKKQKRGPRLSDDDKKITLRICCQDFEIYAHARPKAKFWEHVRERVKTETGKDHASIGKAVQRWEKDRRKVLKAIEDGLFSGEEEADRELLIALDEWISLLDGLKEKQKNREDRIGKAGEETERSRRAQENLGRRWAQKEKSPAVETGDTLNPSVENPASTSQAPAPSSSFQAVPVQALRKRARQQPLPPQPLAEIAAGISGIVAELKADREGTAQDARSELSRLDAEVKELRESVETRLAASDQKISLVLNILLKMEQQQNKERGGDT
jgi:hypothetical protein